MRWRRLEILEALREGPKLTRQLAAALDLDAHDMASRCRSLCVRGLISSQEGVHQLTDAGRAALESGREIKSGSGKGKGASRHRGTLRAKAWRAMHMRDGFSLDDLLTQLCDGSEADAAGNLRDYLRALAGAGYLKEMPKRGDGPQRWRLRRERSGPEAPAWNKRERTLTDPNTGEIFKIPPQSRRASHD